MSQAANYLRSLDENRTLILTEHGIECRRTFATVLIGHPKFVDRTYDPAEVAAALRTYNAALNRIEVITYQELIEAAERTLSLDEELVWSMRPDRDFGRRPAPARTEVLTRERTGTLIPPPV